MQVVVSVKGKPTTATRMTVPCMELATCIPPGVGAQPLRVSVRVKGGEAAVCDTTLSFLPPMLLSCTKTDTRGGVVTVC